MFVSSLQALVIAAMQAASPPVEAFARLPDFESVKISPDGSAIAYPCPTSASQRVCVQDLSGGDGPLVLPVPAGVALTDFYFGGPDHVVFRTMVMDTLNTTSGLRDVAFDRAIVVDLTTQQAATLMRDELWSTSAANVVSLDRTDPESVLVEMTLIRATRRTLGTRIANPASYDNFLYRASLSDGRGRRIDRDESLYRVVDGDGRIKARVFYDIGRSLLTVRTGEPGGDILYEAEHGYDRPRIGGFIDDTGLAFETETGEGRGVLRLDLETGELSDPFGFSDLPYQSPLFDRYDRLWGFVVRSGERRLQRIVDPDLERDRDALSRAIGADAWIEDFSEDRSRILFAVRPLMAPPSFYLYDKSQGAVSPLGPAYPELEDAALPSRRMISYEASDGLEIPAVLTTPPGLAKDEAAPLIVLPHGGPAARDGLDFDWWAQAIASRGYLVLQPNFRGSDGYGEGFREAGFGEFGGSMIEDILDGARHLQATGKAEPGKFCLTGGSYGGYASLMGAVRAPDEVGCVVAFAPVTNPILMLADVSGEGQETSLQFWEEYMGPRFQSRDTANAMSPLAQSDALTMPVIVFHGDLDTVVPIEQSELLERRMRGAANFEYVELTNETHYLNLPSSRRALLERSIALFDEALRPQAQR